MPFDAPCGYLIGDTLCDATPTRRYQPGHRCAQHTPARLAGRPEPGRAAYRLERQVAHTPAETVADVRARESGKRVSGKRRRAAHG